MEQRHAKRLGGYVDGFIIKAASTTDLSYSQALYSTHNDMVYLCSVRSPITQSGQQRSRRASMKNRS